MACEPFDLNPIPPAYREPLHCSCGEPLDHEGERDLGVCFSCQADEAGYQAPDPRTENLMTRAEIDQLCGLTHRRRAS